MNLRTNCAIFLIAVCGPRSFAQVRGDEGLHDTGAPVAEPSIPPLVPIEEEEPMPPLALPAPPGNPPRLEVLEPEAPGRGLRIGMSLLIGAGAGTALAVAGGFIGGAAKPNPRLQPLGNVWAGASVGFAVGAPLGVLLSGLIFKGTGAWWAPIVADLVGFGLGALAVALGGNAGAPLLFALPLGGSVLGYELTSAPSRAEAP